MPPRRVAPLQAPRIAIELLVAHNQERARHKKPALRLSLRLIEAAQKHADWMAANATLSHTGQGGSDVSGRVSATGYTWQSCGENVAMGQRSVPEVTTGWMASPGHRQNILGDFLDAGFAVSATTSGERYWCAVFAKPR